MGFLDGYEASLARLTRWNTTYPMGRIETRIVEFSAEKGYVLVEAKAYRHYDDIVPAGTDFAYGFVSAYQPNMKRWFVEDTVTSAIMRVQQLVMGGAERSTREIMEQVEKTPATVANAEKDYDYWTTKFGDVPSYKTAEEVAEAGTATLSSSMDEIAKQLGGQLVPEAPKCDHGHRVWRESKPGASKVWAGYFCSEREKANQCQPFWYVVGSSGKWAPQL
jgi:hypothetical protein